MATRYFIDSNPLYRTVAGKQAEIYSVDGGNAMGLLVAETDGEAEQMRSAAGVEEITEAQYQERLKKKAATLPPPWPLKPPTPATPKSLEPAMALKGEGAIVVESGASAGEKMGATVGASEPEVKDLLDDLMGQVAGAKDGGK